jgi:hypothetical protein
MLYNRTSARSSERWLQFRAAAPKKIDETLVNDSEGGIPAEKGFTDSKWTDNFEKKMDKNKTMPDFYW